MHMRKGSEVGGISIRLARVSSYRNEGGDEDGIFLLTATAIVITWSHWL